MVKDEKREKCLMDIADAVKKTAWVLQAVHEAELAGITAERREDALASGVEDAEAAMESLQMVVAYLKAAARPEANAAAC